MKVRVEKYRRSKSPDATGTGLQRDITDPGADNV